MKQEQYLGPQADHHPGPVDNPGSCGCVSPPSTKSASISLPLDDLKHASHYESALKLAGFGFVVIPVVPFIKRPALPWDPWIEKLSHASIRTHWAKHPDHELGCIVGDGLIVFDADSPSAVAALHAIEARFGIVPSLIVATRRGEHHYYRRPAGVVAKSDSHCTEKHPERVDIKTGRAMVVLPPSTGKTVKTCTVRHSSELAAVTQEFVDAVDAHNGRPLFRRASAQDYLKKQISDCNRAVTGQCESTRFRKCRALGYR